MAERECERCGTILKGTKAVRARHHTICDQLPPSIEVAQDIIDRQISISQYWRENFKIASQYFFMARFALGLERLRKADPDLVKRWEEWREQHKFRKTESKPKKSSIMQDPNSARRCLRCTIILGVADTGKYCATCAANVRKRVLLDGHIEDDLSDFVTL